MRAGARPSALGLGDFDGDALWDLAVAKEGSNDVSILHGNGVGGFRRGRTVPVGTRPVGLVVGDFDRDGNLDLAMANATSNDIWLLLGDGSGGFSAAATIPLSASPTALASGDLDGDGKLDLIVTLASLDLEPTYSLAVVLGDGLGGFRRLSGPSLKPGPVFVALADLNRDGRLDAVVSSSGTFIPNVYSPPPDSEIAVFFGDGMGDFSSSAHLLEGKAPGAFVVVDLDSDGNPDIVAQIWAGVVLLKGDGSGGLGAPVELLSEWASSIAVGDFDADGRPDLAVGTNLKVSVLLNEGRPVPRLAATFLAGADWAISIVDLNRDGLPDIVAANPFSGEVSIVLTACGPRPTIIRIPSPSRSPRRIVRDYPPGQARKLRGSKASG